MHSINGHAFFSLPATTVANGQRVRMYAFSLGSTIDIHTPVIGLSGQRQAETGEVVSIRRLMPGAVYAAEATINSRQPGQSTGVVTAAMSRWSLTCRKTRSTSRPRWNWGRWQRRLPASAVPAWPLLDNPRKRRKTTVPYVLPGSSSPSSASPFICRPHAITPHRARR